MMDIRSKLILVAKEKLMSARLAITLARRPEYAERALQFGLSDNLVIRTLDNAVWNLAHHLPPLGKELEELSSKFDEALASHFESNPVDASDKLRRWYIQNIKEKIHVLENKLVLYNGHADELELADQPSNETQVYKRKHSRRQHEDSAICPICKKSGIRRRRLYEGVDTPQIFHKPTKGHPNGETHTLTKILKNLGGTVDEFMEGKYFELDHNTKSASGNGGLSRVVQTSPELEKLITNCTTCKQAGYRSVRYMDEYEKPGSKAERHYYDGVTHEFEGKKSASFHRKEELTEYEAMRIAQQKYGQPGVPAAQTKQSSYLRKKA